MTEETKQSETTRQAIPGDIGDYIDDNSLALKIMDAIDRASDRAQIMGTLFHEIDSVDKLDLDPITFETICVDIIRDLGEAHQMICDPQIYPEWKGVSYHDTMA